MLPSSLNSPSFKEKSRSPLVHKAGTQADLGAPMGVDLKMLPHNGFQLGTTEEQRNRPCGPSSYLLARSGALHFRMRVPHDLQACLGRKEYRRSLGTARLREARPKALKLALALHDIFICTRELFTMNAHSRPQPTGAVGQTVLTPERIRELADIHLRRCLQSEFEARIMRGKLSPDDLEEEEETISYCLSDALENIEAGIIPPRVAEVADSLLAEKGIQNPKQQETAEDDPPGMLSYRLLCDKLQRADAASLESQIAGPCWDGSLRRAPGWTVSMAEGFIRERQQPPAAGGTDSTPITPSHATAPQTTEPEGPPPIPTIGEAISKLIEERSPKWGRATAMDTPKRLHTFLSIISGAGKTDITFAEFSRNRDAMRRYHKVMTSIPAQYAKKAEWKDLDWDALAALDLPPELRFKKETLKNNFNTVRGFLSWAEDEGYLERSRVFKKILLELPADVEGGKKRGFTPEELASLFAPENFMTQKTGLDHECPWKFLVPVMALFTGARIEEICQLDLADIRREENGAESLWYLHITDTGSDEDGKAGKTKSVKTKAGIRKVPLHPFLIGMNGSPVNILEYAERLRARGETRLFPMLAGTTARGNVSDAVTKWFTRYRRECGVGGVAGEYSEVTFHSFRHTVITTATKLKDVERRKVKQMVGHEAGLNDAADITTRYEDDYPLSIIARDVIGALDFDTALGLASAFEGWRTTEGLRLSI